MLLVILLGIVSSTVAEIVTALNKKLNGTLLQGDGAFLIAFALALVGAIVKEIATPGFSFSQLGNIANLTATFTEVFATSQLYFLFVVKKLSLDVGSTPIQTPTQIQSGTSSPSIPQ